MSQTLMRRMYLLIPLTLAALAGCQDTIAPPEVSKAQFAQGDGGVWTVNSLGDPGDGTCDDAECTLREAIAAAASGDSIVFAAGLQGDILLQAGEVDVVDKSLTIDGAGRIAVDAQDNSRVMVVESTQGDLPVVALSGLTLKNGSATYGGGIAVYRAVLTLDGVTVAENEATNEGGGIEILSDADVTIRNSVIIHNSTAGSGGAIRNYTSLTVINSTIDSNSALDDGGGIYNSVTFSGGSLVIAASTISGNEAGGDGGGIYLNGGTATITGSTISGNTVAFDQDGGAIYNSLGSLTIRSSAIVKNAGNEFKGQGGLAVLGDEGTASIANTIIAGNTGGDCLRINDGSIVSLGYNLSGACFSSPAAGDVAITPAQLFTEVLEQELKDNGGPNKTHALLARGRAVDAGYCPGETADQRGFPRPVDDPTMPNALDACDIGAYELQGPVAVVADLMVSQAVDKTSVRQGELLTYFVRVQNLGPDDATNVVVTDVLSSGVTFVEARGNQGSFTAPPKGETGTVTWNVGDLLDQGNEVAEIQVTVLVRGRTTVTSTATVTGDVADLNEANNTAAITVSVAAGSSGSGGNGNGGGPKK